jgi:anti-anti-sigma regulatory factor
VREQILMTISGQPKVVPVDLTNVTYMDSIECSCFSI